MYEKIRQAMLDDKETVEWLGLHGAVFALSFRFFPAWCEKQGIPEYETASYIRFGQEFGWLPLTGILLDKERPIWDELDEETRNQVLAIVNKAPFASNPLVRSLVADPQTQSPAANEVNDSEYALRMELREMVESWFVKELGLNLDIVGAQGRSLRKVIDEAPQITIPIHAIDTISKIYSAWNKLNQENGCEPSIEEIANTANVKVEWVEEWMPWILDSRNEEILKNQMNT